MNGSLNRRLAFENLNHYFEHTHTVCYSILKSTVNIFHPFDRLMQNFTLRKYTILATSQHIYKQQLNLEPS